MLMGESCYFYTSVSPDIKYTVLWVGTINTQRTSDI